MQQGFFSPAPVGMQRRADRLQGEVAGLLLRPRVKARLFERADEGEKHECKHRNPF